MTTAETKRKVFENRLRRVAYRLGYRIAKDAGGYMVVDVRSGVAVFGLDQGRVFTASIADVRAFLEKEERKRTK